MAERASVPDDLLRELRSVCLRLPEAYEEAAWVGTRWCVRKRTFAHVLAIADGWPPAYARAAASDGPITVLMFRSVDPELAALRGGGHPYFAPPWRDDEVGMIVDASTDRVQIAELVTDSYRAQAPRRSADQVE